MGSCGSRYFNRSNNSLRVKSDLNQMVSCRVIPVRWDNISRSVTELLSCSLLKRMEGTDSRTGLSQVNLPSSTSMPAEMAVNSLVLDAMGQTVPGVNGSLFS